MSTSRKCQRCWGDEATLKRGKIPCNLSLFPDTYRPSHHVYEKRGEKTLFSTESTEISTGQ